MAEIKKTTNDVVRVQMNNVWKRFPGVVANQGINLELKAGEVHALLGENGAGKTTLMKILAGLYRPDAGEVTVDGVRVDIRSPKQAIKLGIGMVHQHFQLVNNMTVAENVYLGWDDTPWHTSREGLATRLKPIVADLGFAFDPNAEIWQLSVGEQQRAEILQVMVRGARVLILDEPTAVLTPGEAAELFTALRDLVARGQTVVFISHKLLEVLEVSDRVTVLRGGQNVATRLTSECDQRMLAEMMVGRSILFQRPEKKGLYGPTILELRGVEALNDRGLLSLKGVDLDVRQGEILGIAGVAGNGQTELAEVLTGLRPIQSGSVHIGAIDLTGSSPREYARAGVGHIPEDKTGMGLFPSLSLTHNAILREYKNPPIRRGIRLIWRAAEQFTQRLIKQADVRASNIDASVGTLSGGNQQKLLVSRETDIATGLLVAVHPTRGLDIGATEAVRNALLSHQDRGFAVILISEDLDEILLLSDRIAVMFEGRIQGVLTRHEATYERIGLLMGGAVDVEETADD